MFENNKPYVIDEFREGRFDYLELASDVAETKFFQFLFDQGLVDQLARHYPSPRKRHHVPLWMYVSSQLSLRLHGSHSFHSYPLIIRAGGLIDALGRRSRRRKVDPQTGDMSIWCAGFNDRNLGPRSTPCDQDYLRKLAKDTDPQKLERVVQPPGGSWLVVVQSVKSALDEFRASVMNWAWTRSRLKQDVREGRISIDRLVDLIVTLQRQLQEARRRIEELEKKLGGSGTAKVSEPFSVRAEEQRQKARGKKRRSESVDCGGDGSARQTKSLRRSERNRSFPIGVAASECRLSHTRPVWRLENGQAVLVAYEIYRGPTESVRQDSRRAGPQ